MNTQPLDLSRLRVYPLAERDSMTRADDILLRVDAEPPSLSDELSAGRRALRGRRASGPPAGRRGDPHLRCPPSAQRGSRHPRRDDETRAGSPTWPPTARARSTTGNTPGSDDRLKAFVRTSPRARSAPGMRPADSFTWRSSQARSAVRDTASRSAGSSSKTAPRSRLRTTWKMRSEPSRRITSRPLGPSCCWRSVTTGFRPAGSRSSIAGSTPRSSPRPSMPVCR